MTRNARFLAAAALASVFGLVAVDGNVLAQPKDQERKVQKVKGHKHVNGKALLGTKLKKDGKHELQKRGKHTSFVNVKGGKITGMTVTHAEKGNVAVKKYKTTKKMVELPGSMIKTVSYNLAQYQYVDTMWIGYAYYDDEGYEVIYWYEYDLVYDGDTGAYEYIAV